MPRPHPKSLRESSRVRLPQRELEPDLVICEAPLHLVVNEIPFVTTMRTPGDDFELVCGLLFSEGLIQSSDDILSMERCAFRHDNNTIAINIRGEVDENLFRRGTLMNSACGVCGKTSIGFDIDRQASRKSVSFQQISSAMDALQTYQGLFSLTGSCHAAMLSDREGNPLCHFEDVGRHNAVDKCIGAAMRDQQQTKATILVVSSRLSFEIVQKAARIGVSAIASVSGPTSLAIESAHEAGIDIYAFVRNGKANHYPVEST